MCGKIWWKCIGMFSANNKFCDFIFMNRKSKWNTNYIVTESIIVCHLTPIKININDDCLVLTSIHWQKKSCLLPSRENVRETIKSSSFWEWIKRYVINFEEINDNGESKTANFRKSYVFDDNILYIAPFQRLDSYKTSPISVYHHLT